jgi:general secretion pathway protein D
MMFLDDDVIPVLPEWDEQIKQLEEIRDAEPAAETP